VLLKVIWYSLEIHRVAKLGINKGFRLAAQENIDIQAKLFFKLNETNPVAQRKYKIHAVALVRGNKVIQQKVELRSLQSCGSCNKEYFRTEILKLFCN